MDGKTPSLGGVLTYFAGFIREIHGHHLIHDTMVSQEASGLINAGYAALFEIALSEETPHGCLH